MRTATILLAVTALTACSSDTFQSFVSSGDAYLAARQYAEASIQFQNAARLDPQSPDAQMKLGEIYAALAEPAKSAAAYERACALDPAREEACSLAASQRVALGEQQWQAGNPTAAEASLVQSVELAPSASGARVRLAQLYLETGRLAQGERELRAALKADPADPAANRMYATYLSETNRCSEAEAYWQNVAARSADGSGAVALADYYVWSGRPDDAVRILNPLTQSRDEDGAARTRLAAILYDRGDRTGAARLVNALLAEDQSNVNGLVLRARMLLGDRDAAGAQADARRAAAEAPQAPAVLDVLAAIQSAASNR